MSMAKIIKGKRYNTGSAIAVGYWYSKFPNDCYTETLYRKKTGEYFLHRTGNNLGYTADGASCHGELIIPLSNEVARQWAKEKISADGYEMEFGDKPSDSISHLSFRVSHTEAEKLKQYALKHNKSQLTVVRDYIKTL